MIMNEETKRNIEMLEKEARFPTGIGKLERGECEITKLANMPLVAVNPIFCQFYQFGHILECHYPMTCEEAVCSHYQREMEEEYDTD